MITSSKLSIIQVHNQYMFWLKVRILFQSILCMLPITIMLYLNTTWDIIEWFKMIIPGVLWLIAILFVVVGIGLIIFTMVCFDDVVRR